MGYNITKKCNKKKMYCFPNIYYIIDYTPTLKVFSQINTRIFFFHLNKYY